MEPANNINNPVKNYNVIIETFKRKPLKSVICVSAIVAAVALAVLLCVFAVPAVPIAATIAYAAIIAAAPSFLLGQEISASFFERYKRNRTLEKVHNSDLVLVLEATTDHNGTFSLNQKQRFKKLEKSHEVAFKKVSTIQDIQQSLIQTRRQNNTIKSIWIRAHGCASGMLLSKQADAEHSLDVRNVHQLESELSRLTAGTSIILDSCSTAADAPRGHRNIAQRISACAKNCPVFAACRDTSQFSTKLKKDNPLHVEFWTGRKTSKKRLLKYPSRFFNRVAEIIFIASNKNKAFRKLAYNATKVYQTA